MADSMRFGKTLSRRSLLAWTSTAVGVILVAACAPAAPPSPTAAQPAAAPPTQAPTQAPAVPTSPPVTATTAAPAATGTTAAPAATATAAPAAAATPTAAPAAATTAGGQINGSFFGSTNPWTTSENPQMIDMIFNRLVERKQDYTTIIPGLASSWKISEDSLTYTFQLRKDVKWHDGTPFTSKDVVWSYKTLLDPKASTFGSFLPAYSVYPIKGGADFKDGKATDVAGLKAPDDFTVEITTEKPAPTLLGGLSCCWILPQHILGSVAIDQLPKHDFFTKQLVGTGSFMFKTFVADQYLTLVKNPNYFRGAPKIDQVTAKKLADASVTILGLEKGELNVISSQAPDDVERLKANAKYQVWAGPPALLQSIGVNVGKPYLADKRVRQALLYAIDRDTIVKSLFKGTAQVINGFTAPWVDQSGNNQYQYNPDMAKQLLKDAKFDPKQSLELMVYYTDDFSRRLAAAFQQYWQDAGLTTTIRQSDYANLEPDYTAGKWDLIYQGSSSGLDPYDMSIYFHSKSDYNKGPAKIVNPEYDRLFDAGGSTVDQAARAKAYSALSKILIDESPWLFLWAPLRFWIADKSIQNIKDTLGTPRFHPAVYHAEETWQITG